MRTILFLATLTIWGILAGCEKTVQVAIIPKPSKINDLPGSFSINKKTAIYLDKDNHGVKKVVDDFRAFLKVPMGFEIGYTDNLPPSGYISITIDSMISNEEGYLLRVTPDNITIEALSDAGVFYALQTLRQLLSFEIENRFEVNRTWEINAVEIEDFPRFGYRGFMLDLARHNQPTEVIKKYIDLLSFYKINHLHLHLTEDQGWRIEIKKYPRLTEVASKRKETLTGHLNPDSLIYDGIPYGGYYTQEELKEIVAYARSRQITIIPEIEMPGHALAALAAYPHLGCTGGPYEVATHWGVFEDVFCAGNEDVFSFLENVLLEVMEIFPGEYIHIGGDECPKTRWKECTKCQARIRDEGLKDEYELQSYFIRRIGVFLNSYGRKLIGWDEITEGGLAPGATVMYWRTWLGDDHIIEAANAGFNVIMTPLDPLYFNLYEDADRENAPLAYPGLIPLEKVYDYNPLPLKLSDSQAQSVIGVQANLWSEYIKNGETAEYMTFPRACALAEIAWSPYYSKDYADFIRRLKINSTHLEIMDVNFSKYFLN